MLRQWLNDRNQKHKGMIDKLQKHTNDLIPELKKWAESPLISSNEYLFLRTQQHIETGYFSDLWSILNDDNNGIRATESKYDNSARALRKQIRSIIQEQISKEIPKVKIENLEWFVEDIKEFLEKKVLRNAIYVFRCSRVEVSSTTVNYLDSIQPNGSLYRKEYLNGLEEHVEKLAKILNNILEDYELLQRTKDLYDLGEKLHQIRVSFQKRMNYLIDELVHAVSDEEKIILGTCDAPSCRDIKRKLKLI
jgi:hypothetical protein